MDTCPVAEQARYPASRPQLRPGGRVCRLPPLLELDAEEVGAAQSEAQRYGGILGMTVFAGVAISMSSGLPGLLLAAAAEYYSARSLWIYIVGAVVIGSFAGLPFSSDAKISLIGAALGPVAGVVYWYLAGRSAGSWRTPNASSEAAPSLPIDLAR